MEDFELFQIYSAVTLHFKNTSYDYFKYNGKCNVSESSYSGRTDKYFFTKFSGRLKSKEEAIGFVVSNVLYGDNILMRSFDHATYYTKWVKYKCNLLEEFSKEYKVFKKNKEDDSEVNLIDLCFCETLSKEFIIILDIVFEGRIFSALDKKQSVIWDDKLKPICEKYRPFIYHYWNIDSELLKNVVINNK